MLIFITAIPGFMSNSNNKFLIGVYLSTIYCFKRLFWNHQTFWIRSKYSFFCICLFLYVSMQSVVNGIRFRDDSFRAYAYLPRYYLNDFNLNAGKTSNHRGARIKAACYLENWICILTFTYVHTYFIWETPITDKRTDACSWPLCYTLKFLALKEKCFFTFSESKFF